MTEATATTISGGQLLAKQLAMEGIDTVFGVAAGPMGEAFAALPREGIRVIGCRHEENAAFMAQAYGYITKQPGVVMVGSGPGMANTVPSMYVAQENGWPLVVLGGSAYGVRRGLGGFQEAPQVAMARPVCKWVVEVDSVGRIPEHLHVALGKAMSGRPGAVYVDFPGQLIARSIAEEHAELRQIPSPSFRPHAEPAAIAAIADLMCQARRPLVIVGKGAAWSDAADSLTRLVHYGIPFIASPLGRGTIPDDDPYCVGAARSFALNNADAILMVGGRFNWMFLPNDQVGGQRTGVRRPEVRIAQIDLVAEEMRSAVTVDIGVVADCAVAVDALCLAMDGRRLQSANTGWLQQLREQALRNQAAVERFLRSDKVPINPYRLWNDVKASLDRDATVVVDGEITLGVGRIVMPSYYPRHRLNPGTTGFVGAGVAFAIAAKLARPDRQVIAVVGDYAFGAGCNDIETAARVGANVVFVISNNQGIAGHLVQEALFRPEDGAIGALLPARYEKMAEMVGGYGELVEDPAEIKPALGRALAAETVAIVNVFINPRGIVRPDTSRRI